ncbi:MAG: RNA polymerase factor sigma-32 [Sneathiella sp.]|jgi:RNA polymerase sigma-32 factor|uniref:RNA polymerase factor sigma-32 n=1 Tax=Sneathiella sp. TaxID=1964365 RepID=UPI000C379515|nr:RNA polymerase factor sigma-32 [Sneathiella sp.]MAL80472.1 RNA polymerase factor sigma-32 [Sneathiella sp.]
MTKHETANSHKRNRAFVSAAMSVPLLTREREFELAYRWREKGDEKALHELVSAYMRLVVSVASKFRNYGLSMSDLVQEGNIGLMQAAFKFEPEREIRFSTYATWWIKSAMQDYVLRNWSIVRSGTSASQKSLFFNLRWLRAKIQNMDETAFSSDTLMEISRKLKIGIEDVEKMANRLSSRDQSLNAPVGEEGDDSVEDFLRDTGPTPEESTMHSLDGAVRSKWLESALQELSEREQIIIRERRLLDDKTTLEVLGERLGITKERVRQIEHKAFEKLRSSVVRISREAVRNPVLSGPAGDNSQNKLV